MMDSGRLLQSLVGVVFAIVLAGTGLGSVARAATTIRVPADAPTIQAAIAMAANGDTVLVSPGTYVENIDFLGKAIRVTSEGGPAVTIIDGGSNGSVATFASGEGSNSILSGFTLRNGRSGFDTPGFGDGGGVRIQDASPTVIRNTITNNKACVGPGMSIRFGSPRVERNTIVQNEQSGCSGGTGGGGIGIIGTSTAQIINNVISGNIMTSADGGGISLFGAGTPTISHNTITNNTATGLSPCAKGGGISLVNDSDALIMNNIISRNNAGCGGGIYWLVPSGARGPFVVNNTIVDNNAPEGSGVLADGFDAQSLLINNIVVAAPGQTAIHCGSFNDLNPPMIRFNDVFSASGPEYGGICTDQTGVNGNISADPLFVDQAGGNYHLTAGSPAIDRGDNSAPGISSRGRDIDGQPRIVDGNGDQVAVVDMGADEFVTGR